MEIKKVNLSALKLNDRNPRLIKDFKFQQLVKSILTFPKMLELREIVTDEAMMVLGGNMRLRALQHIAKMTEQELRQQLKSYDREELTDYWMTWHDCPMENVKIARGLTDEQKQEFIAKDNVAYGEWDWDILANEYDEILLRDWGVDLPVYTGGSVMDEIINDAFIDKNEIDIFSITFNFPKEQRDDIESKIKSVGKKEVTNKIIELLKDL
jgi:hypothetical protein